MTVALNITNGNILILLISSLFISWDNSMEKIFLHKLFGYPAV